MRLTFMARTVHALLRLQDAVDPEEQGRVGEDSPEAVELIGADDDVYEARFILESEEQETLGGARALAADDGAAHADEVAVALIRQVDRTQDVGRLELIAKTRHRMRADGEVRCP
jgi:hypothetical protein